MRDREGKWTKDTIDRLYPREGKKEDDMRKLAEPTWRRLTQDIRVKVPGGGLCREAS